MNPCGRLAGLLLVLAVLAVPRPMSGGLSADSLPGREPGWKGRTLTEALQRLSTSGLRLVFSNRVVLPGMVVVAEPTAGDPRAILDELLAPHSLAVQEGPGGTLVVVPAPAVPRLDDPASTARRLRSIDVAVTVQPSRLSLLREEPGAPLALGREEIRRLPHLGGDVFRALSLLPGATSTDISAQPRIRGGRPDEVAVLLDGQELYEAYHLKDFDSALSVVASSSLETLDLSTGAFPATYGDRIGGVLDLSTLTPATKRRFRLSASVLTAELEGSGPLGGDAGWLASARRGFSELASAVVGQASPSFWDVLARLDYRPGPRHSLRAHVLVSGDTLEVDQEDGGERTRLDTDYDGFYAWVSHQAVASQRLVLETTASFSRVRRDRFGLEVEDEKRAEVLDQRDLLVSGLSQAFSLQLGTRDLLKAGYEVRRFDAAYDYRSDTAFTSPLARLRSPRRDGPFAFRDRLRDDYLGAYVSGRLRLLEELTLEAGLRYDGHSLTRDHALGPRAAVAWGVGPSSVVRLAWGRYSQGQRAYELQVEDGETVPAPVERSEHWVAGFEHVLSAKAAGVLTALRLEAYRRRAIEPRPRYEGLFEAFEPLPEGAFDRVRVAPSGGVAEGLELSLRGRAGPGLEWWLRYDLSKAEDLIDGRRVPRRTEQRHALNVDVNADLGRRWQLNLAWRYHTGWRTTPISLSSDPEGELVPVLGALNSERLPPHHRLDLRVSRRWALRWLSLTAFADVQNLYHRRNVAGYDLEIDEERRVLVAQPELWPGFFASAGISAEF